MRLIFHRRPGMTALWLGEARHKLELPEGALLGLHLPRPAPSSKLVVTTADGETRLAGPAAGWSVLSLTARVLSLHVEGPPLRLSGGYGEGPEFPACRIWSGEGLIPEAHWRAARILGEGGLLALGGGPARPFLRLRAGEMGRIALPATSWAGLVEPLLSALRGELPLAELDGLTLTLRAGAFCEILWEDVQLRPNSLANSLSPSLR